jgi:hypothetical protein
MHNSIHECGLTRALGDDVVGKAARWRTGIFAHGVSAMRRRWHRNPYSTWRITVRWDNPRTITDPSMHRHPRSDTFGAWVRYYSFGHAGSRSILARVQKWTSSSERDAACPHTVREINRFTPERKTFGSRSMSLQRKEVESVEPLVKFGVGCHWDGGQYGYVNKTLAWFFFFFFFFQETVR